MPNATDVHMPNRPGPRPVFTEKLLLKFRPDERQALNRIAKTLGLSVSEVVRWFVDQGINAVEAVPEYHELQRRT